jgi:hypothetical protein
LTLLVLTMLSFLLSFHSLSSHVACQQRLFAQSIMYRKKSTWYNPILLDLAIDYRSSGSNKVSPEFRQTILRTSGCFSELNSWRMHVLRNFVPVVHLVFLPRHLG